MLWLVTLFAPMAAATTVADAFPPPLGASRVAAEPFGASLGALVLEPADQPVHTFAGDVVAGHHARVIELPMVKGDLQQCADMAIRVRAEWLKSQGQPVSFHATSGDPIGWSRWQGGERPYEVENKLQWKAGTNGGWDAYLMHVFLWAGTWSLQEFDTQPVSSPMAGDVIVEGGFPGHAVLVLDVATRSERTWILIGEGFMPAQDFHVELGPDNGWWEWTDKGLALPHWPLAQSALRRWK